MSMKSKSTRRLMVIACATVLIVGTAGGVYVAQKYEMRQRLSHDRTEGIEAAKNGNYELAVKDLTKFMAHRPADIDVLQAYVKARPHVGKVDVDQVRDLVRRYRQIETLDATDAEAPRHLMEIFSAAQMWPEAKAQAQALLKIAPKDSDGLKYLFMAKVHLRGQELTGSKQNNVRSAMEVADDWIAADPKNAEPYLARLELMQQTGVSDSQITAWAAKICGAKPSTPLQQLIAAEANLLTNNPQKAADLLKTAAQQPMPSADFAKILAEQLNRMHLYADSMDLLQSQARLHPDDETIVEELAQRHWEAGELKEVVSLTDPVQSKLSVQGIALRAMALRQMGKTQEADKLAAKLAGEGNPSAAAWALLLQQTGPMKPDAAQKIISACQLAIQNQGNRPHPYLQYFMARAYSTLDEKELAIDALTNVARTNATWAAPLVTLSDLELAKGRPTLAKDAAIEAWRRSGKNNAAAAFALAKAWSVISETNSKNTGAPPPPELMTLVEQMHEKLPDQEQTLEMYLSLLCSSQPPQTAKAKTELSKALEGNTKFSPQGLVRLAALSRAFDLGLTDACFDRARKIGGATPDLAYGQAVNLYTNGKPADGLKLLEQAKGSNDSAQWQFAWARYLELIHDPRAAKEWESLGNANPENLNIQQALLTMRSVQTDHEFMAKTIDRVKALTGPEAIGWRLAQAQQTLAGQPSQKELVQTSLELKQICGIANDMAEPFALLANCYDRLGNLPAALQQARTACEKDPTNSQFAIYYSHLLQRHGDFDQARGVLEKLASKNLNSTQRQQAAELLAQQGDAQRAISLLQQAAGDNDQDNLLLAMLYRQQGHTKEVSALCPKLLEHPDSPSISFVADFYASQGQMDQAKQTLALLDQLKLHPGTKQMVLADFDAHYVSMDAAIKDLQSATAAAPDDPATWRELARAQWAIGDAAAAGKTLSDSAKPLPSDASLTLLRQNVELLGSSCASTDLRPLVVAVAQAPTSDSIPLAALQQVQASKSAGENASQLVARLQKLLDANPQSLPLRILTIQRYMAIGNSDALQQATQLATQGIQMFPTQAEPAALAVQTLMASGNWNQALGYTRVWRKRTPTNTLPADMAAAQAQLNLGNANDAVGTLAPYQSQLSAHPDQYADALMLYCVALNQAGEADQAASLVWPEVSKEPAWRTRWINLALSCKVAASAANWLTKIEPVLPANAIQNRTALAQAWEALGQRAGNKTYMDNSQRLFKQLVDRPDVTADALEGMGIVQEQLSNPTEAAKYYRRALSMKADLPISLNNLAMILARTDSDLSEALSLAQRAVKASPKSPTIYDTLSFVQARKKDVDGAVATIKKAVAMDPTNMLWKVHEARILWDGGRHAQAQSLVAEINNMTPQPGTIGEKATREWQALKTEMSKQASAKGA